MTKLSSFHPLRPALYVMLLMVVLLAGCATSGPVDGCSWARPIYVSPDDSLTDGTAKQILSHDLTGADICGWKKSKRAE